MQGYTGEAFITTKIFVFVHVRVYIFWLCDKVRQNHLTIQAGITAARVIRVYCSLCRIIPYTSIAQRLPNQPPPSAPYCHHYQVHNCLF